MEMKQRLSARERFLEKLKRQKNGCQIWQGGEFFWNGKKQIRPARFSYSEFVGRPGLKKVYNTCSIVGCVAPKHLVASKMQGERHPRSILSNAQCRQIRAIYKRGRLNQEQLAIKFSVSLGNINKIVNRKTRL